MATRQKHSNSGTSTLLGAFNIGATSCSVQAGHGARYPSPGANEMFKFTLKDAAGNIEICKCTQRTVDTFNVVARAQEGTTERNWLAGDLVEARLTRDTMDGLPQKDAVEIITEAWSFDKTLTQKHGTDVVSANNLTLGDGNIFNITGSTTINTIATKGVGTIVLLQFAAALQLTHHATDLILPTGANIVTAAGDTAIFEEYATGDWRCWMYQRASGASLGFASTAETKTGTEAAKSVTPAGLKGAIGFSNYFESAEQTPSFTGSGSTGALAHGLGGRPILVKAYLRCKTAEVGYSIGDEIEVYGELLVNGMPPIAIWSDATNVGLSWQSRTPTIPDKNTGAGTVLTTANWGLYVRAWR